MAPKTTTNTIKLDKAGQESLEIKKILQKFQLKRYRGVPRKNVILEN